MPKRKTRSMNVQDDSANICETNLQSKKRSRGKNACVNKRLFDEQSAGDNLGNNKRLFSVFR